MKSYDEPVSSTPQTGQHDFRAGPHRGFHDAVRACQYVPLCHVQQRIVALSVERVVIYARICGFVRVIVAGRIVSV